MPVPSMKRTSQLPSSRRQSGVRRRSRHVARQLAWLSLGCLPAMAQDGLVVTGRAWTVIPRLGVTTELSNVSGNTAEPGRSSTELITQLAPSLQVTSRGGRVRGTLDATLLGTVHARDSERNGISGSLALNGQADIIPQWVYLDAAAVVSQQSASGYGLGQSNTSLRGSDRFREVASFTLSPFMRGNLGSWADYELRYTDRGSYVRRSSDENSNDQTASASLRSRTAGRLGWGLDASSQRVSFGSGRDTRLDRGVVSLFYAPMPDLRFAARAGRESTDVNSLSQQSYDTFGAGVSWAPSPRTTFSADVDKRYFGTGYRVVAEHRWRRASVRISSVRDTTTGIDPNGVGQPTTLLQLYMLQYASIEPDPGLRDLRVRELLRLTNQSPTTLVNGGLTTAAVSLQRRTDVAVSLLGVRGSVTAQAYMGSTQTVDRLSPAAIDGRIRQEGLLVLANYSLTPIANLTFSAAYGRSRDGLPLSAGGSTASANLGLTTSLDRRTTVSVGARYTRDRGTIYGTREIAVNASANRRF